MNLGSSVNTIQFDAYFAVTGSGDTAYFSSVHNSSSKGFGRSDIWKVWLPEDLRPGVSPLKKQVVQRSNEQTLPEVKAEDLIGSLFRLDSVYFDPDKSTIREDSKRSLVELVKLLQKYPTIKIEVQGHTDSDGAEEYNRELSLTRAEAVQAFLVEQGLESGRLIPAGYGESEPIAPNDTPEGKQLNRRVMVLVKSMN